MDPLLKNHKALIVGASRGLGKEIAIRLAEYGANLGLMARTKQDLQETAEICQRKGGIAHPIVADAANERDTTKAFNQFIKQEQRIDILVLCQGIIYRSQLVDDQQDYWRKVMSINLLSHMQLTRLALPYLLKSLCPVEVVVRPQFSPVEL